MSKLPSQMSYSLHGSHDYLRLRLLNVVTFSIRRFLNLASPRLAKGMFREFRLVAGRCEFAVDGSNVEVGNLISPFIIASDYPRS